MSKYGKATVRSMVAESLDVNTPSADTQEVEFISTPDLYRHEHVKVPTTGLIVDLSEYTTIYSLLVVNKATGSGQEIRVDMDVLLKSVAAGDLAFARGTGGASDTITDTLGGSFATKGRIGGMVYVDNSENTGENNGPYVITNISGNSNEILSVAPYASGGNNIVIHAHDTTATLAFVVRCSHNVPINNGQLLVSEDVSEALALASKQIVLYSQSGTPEVEIFVVGV